jgi:hypothetical protein
MGKFRFPYIDMDECEYISLRSIEEFISLNFI